MPEYNKIDDGAKEAVMRVLKTHLKKSNKPLKEPLKGGNRIEDIVELIVSTLLKLGRKVNPTEVANISSFMLQKKYNFEESYGKSPNTELLILYYFYPKIDDNSSEGYDEREKFINEAKDKLGLLYGYNISTAESGLINEIAFIDTFFPDKKEKLLPGMSKLLSDDISFDPVDFVIDGIPVEVKSLSYCKDNPQSTYPNPVYGIERAKVKKIINSNPSHSVVVWAEQCSSEWRKNNRNSSINWKFIILSSDKFKVMKELELYKQRYSGKASKVFEYFDTIVVKELTNSSQIFDVSSYDNYFVEETKHLID